MARKVVTGYSLYARIWDALTVPVGSVLALTLTTMQQAELSGKACPAWWNRMQETLAKEAGDG